jgi:hypothetical protein
MSREANRVSARRAGRLNCGREHRSGLATCRIENSLLVMRADRPHRESDGSDVDFATERPCSAEFTADPPFTQRLLSGFRGENCCCPSQQDLKILSVCRGALLIGEELIYTRGWHGLPLLGVLFIPENPPSELSMCKKMSKSYRRMLLTSMALPSP